MEAVVSGVELIQRVVPREALSQIDSICYLIVIAPIYLQYLDLVFGSRWAMTKVPR